MACASSNDHVGRSSSKTTFGLQSEIGHQPVRQCCELHVPWYWVPGEGHFFSPLQDKWLYYYIYNCSHFLEVNFWLGLIIVVVGCQVKYTWGYSFKLFCSCLAKSCSRSPHKSQGPPRCLDKGWHHSGVLSEHENESMYLAENTPDACLLHDRVILWLIRESHSIVCCNGPYWNVW